MQMQMFWLLSKINLAEHDKFFKFHDVVGRISSQTGGLQITKALIKDVYEFTQD